MPSSNNYRFSYEEKIYLELLRNTKFKKASEEALSSISLHHKPQTEFTLATDGFELTEKNSPELFKEFSAAKKNLKLNPKTKISLYIKNDQQINAGCIFLSKEDYAVYLNAGLINIMNIDELNFVIGHELGHLKYLHHKIIKDQLQKISPATQIRLFEHSRYAEISADRCGLIAAGSLEVSKNALLKLSTGTDLTLIDQSQNNTSIEIKALQDLIETDKGLINEKLSHPYSQIRIYALEKFNECFSNDSIIKSRVVEVDKKIAKVLSLLNPKIDELKSLAFIYASLWVSYSHEKNLKIELEHIEDICDPIFLSRIVKKSKDISNKNKFYEKEFRKIIDSKERVLTLSEKSDLLDKISLVAAVDGDLHQNEKKVLYSVAKILDLPKNYVDAVLNKIQT